MTTDLKIRLKIQDQPMTLWGIIKETDDFIMFRASITSGKKNPDGTWDNISQNFTCFAKGEVAISLKRNFSEKAKINISGSITLLPEKRQAMGQNGAYQEAIFSNAIINADQIEFLDKPALGYSVETYTTGVTINDGIPF